MAKLSKIELAAALAEMWPTGRHLRSHDDAQRIDEYRDVHGDRYTAGWHSGTYHGLNPVALSAHYSDVPTPESDVPMRLCQTGIAERIVYV